jgi:hypothetical protein
MILRDAELVGIEQTLRIKTINSIVINDGVQIQPFVGYSFILVGGKMGS